MAVGGVADIFVIVDTSIKKVVDGYWSIIGHPLFTPQWALGWHQCKWGYWDT
jgi:alpha-glucosidase